MPSILTHYGFNKQMFDNNINFLKENEDIYLVGAQGPDPFFFKGLIPSFKSKGSSTIRKYGSTLHHIEPSEVFKAFIEYANESDDKDVLYAYILGAGLHYILDRKIHPYVYYKTGFSDEKKAKSKYFVDHTLFETNIDVLLMNGKFNHYKVKKPIEAIRCDDDKIEEVSEMFEFIAKNVVKEEKVEEESFENAYKDMCLIERFLYSKRGIKKKIIGLVAKNTPLNTMMHPRVIKDDDVIDYLNLKRNMWKDPCLGTIFNKSVEDLIEEAKIEAEEFKKIIVDAYNGNFKIEALKEFTKEIMYGGYNYKDKMKEFDSVFEKK